MSVTLLLDEDSQTLHQSMTFTELLTEAKKLRPPDQIRLAAELLQCINVQGFQASLLPQRDVSRSSRYARGSGAYGHISGNRAGKATGLRSELS